MDTYGSLIRLYESLSGNNPLKTAMSMLFFEMGVDSVGNSQYYEKESILKTVDRIIQRNIAVQTFSNEQEYYTQSLKNEHEGLLRLREFVKKH